MGVRSPIIAKRTVGTTVTELVISPHLDDAVFSIGQYLAARPGTVVVTVFAGLPGRSTPGMWDRRCGFADGRAAMAARRVEDAEAMAELGCEAVHLNFQDWQYGQPAADDQVTAALLRLISERQPSTVLGPVGFVHPDHRQVGRVWRRIARYCPTLAIIAYEELPYRIQFPALAAAAANAFVAAGATAATPEIGGLADKARAMRAYRSQLGITDTSLCLEPERLWSFPGGFKVPTPTLPAAPE